MNWPEDLGLLAEVYHFQPSELSRFRLADLKFWSARLEETFARWRATHGDGTYQQRSSSR